MIQPMGCQWQRNYHQDGHALFSFFLNYFLLPRQLRDELKTKKGTRPGAMNPPRASWCQKPTGQPQAPSTQPPSARVGTENTRSHPKALISSPCLLHPVAPRVPAWMLACPESDKNVAPSSRLFVSRRSLSRSVTTLKNFGVYPLRANHKYSFRSVLGMHYLLQEKFRAVVVVVLVFCLFFSSCCFALNVESNYSNCWFTFGIRFWHIYLCRK